jgi:hypothetical protein
MLFNFYLGKANKILLAFVALGQGIRNKLLAQAVKNK